MAQPTDISWLANPDMISSAIKVLATVVCAAFAFLTTSLVGILLYIWQDHKKAIEKMSAEFKSEVGRLAHSLETISETLFDRQRSIEIRMGEHETRCEERNKHRRCDD